MRHKQGHHQNGDRVAQWSHTSCTICVHSFGALVKMYDCSLHHFTASQYIIKCAPYDIFINLQPVGWNLKEGLFSTSQFGAPRGGWGWAYSKTRAWVLISSPLTHIVYLSPFLSYLAGSKSVSAHPSNLVYRYKSYRFIKHQKRVLSFCLST